MKVQHLKLILATDILIWLRDFEQIYKSMVKEASIKHDIAKKILNKEFLIENILKEGKEINNIHHLQEKKISNYIKVLLQIHNFETLIMT